MNIIDKNNIYDRLLKMVLEIQANQIPNPHYINEKIGQCHLFIEEVEKYGIQVCKEMSIIQRALNDALTHYSILRQDLLSNNKDISSLPSIKDREARADSLLKSNLNEIQNYKNELSDLKNLFSVTTSKMKNLIRVNNDIKVQLRLMESQIRLNAMSPAQQVTAHESRLSDIFKNVETSLDAENTVDPSDPTELNNLLKTDDILETLIDPNPATSLLPPENVEELNTEPESTPVPLNNNEVAVDVKPEEENDSSTPPCLSIEEEAEDFHPSEDILKEVERETVGEKSDIGLDNLLGGVADKKIEPKKEIPKTEIDINSLLLTFNK